MKRTHWMLAAVSLLLFFGLAAADWAAAQGRWRQEAERDVEEEGWRAAHSAELTEQEAGRGEVAPGISIFAGRGTMEMMRLHDWANALIQQAAEAAGSSRFSQEEQFQTMRFTVRTVRELLRGPRSGSGTLDLNGLKFKAGVLERRGRFGRLFVPYVALRSAAAQKDWRRQDSVPWQQAPPSSAAPQQQEQFFPDASADPLNAFRLTNTARQISGDRWEWTAFIDGPAPFLRRISSVTYHLHSTFNPSRRQGDSSRLGHPLTAVGWGVFLLRADVTLDDGTRRSYEHTLQFQ
ncbi:pYEATS domain-containing protein [Candidatus Electronema sp. JC]|uniref:pYEATS domain-containing protein n=1 Tax=Candidatus Electronema sp. JC TaxID=3401570 RepID=UPI003B4359FE